jgi:hypothetical protein
MGPWTGQTGAGFGGRFATGFFAAAGGEAVVVDESTVTLSGRGARVVSWAAAGPATNAMRTSNKVE